MRIEWLTTNITDVGSPTRVESEMFWMIVDIFWTSLDAFEVRDPLCDLETPPGVPLVIWKHHIEP